MLDSAGPCLHATSEMQAAQSNGRQGCSAGSYLYDTVEQGNTHPKTAAEGQGQGGKLRMKPGTVAPGPPAMSCAGETKQHVEANLYIYM